MLPMPPCACRLTSLSVVNIVLLLLLLPFLGGCVAWFPGHAYKTVVDGGSINASNVVEKSGAGPAHKDVTTFELMAPGQSAPGNLAGGAATAPAGVNAPTPAGFVPSPPAPSPPTTGDPVAVTWNGNAIHAPAGSGLRITHTIEDSVKPESYSHSRSASSTGGSFRTDGEGIGNFSGSPPKVSIGGDDAEGDVGGSAGSVASKWDDVVSIAQKGTAIFYWLGGLVLVGAIVFFLITKDWMDAIFIGLAGLGMILCGVLVNNYPWVGLLILLAGLASAAGYFVWTRLQAARLSTANQAVVAAVENSSPSAQAEVKANMTDEVKRVGSWLKAHITKVKQDLGITPKAATPAAAVIAAASAPSAPSTSP